MPQLLLVILNDDTQLPDLLQVWGEIGVPGTTIINSVGGHASRTWLSEIGLGGINKLFEAKEVQTRTVIAVIDDEKLLAQAIAEAERIVGGFDQPNSGVLLVLPISKAVGIYKKPPQVPKEVSPPALRSDWSILRDTPIDTVDSLLRLDPTIVSGSALLDDVARAMLAHPRVHVASVVADDGRLIGLIQLSELADDLFFHILPEEFLTEITDLEAMIAFAEKTRAITAQDAMIPPVWVKSGETVKEAFKRMHANKLPGLPIVDERYQVIGYINLLELLSLCVTVKNADNPSEKK
ncbi:MAG: CBS domain-containing protein [Chloroflexota bacterium]